MQMDAFHWKKSQPLAEDYIQGLEQAAGLFHYHYRNDGDWFSRAEWLSQSGAPRADRTELIKALQVYNERVGNHGNAMDHIAKLADKDALAIVGGQQAGLFGGPLLVIYKAVTLIQLAKQWSSKLKRPVVPVFWIAGEDHDFDEVNHVHILSSELQIEKIKVEHPTGVRASVSRLPLKPEAWEEAIESLDRLLMDSEFKQSLMEQLKRTTPHAGSLSEAFARFMAELFGEYGLVLLDSDDPGLRRIEASMFERLIQNNAELNEALLQSCAKVEAAGYPIQAEVTEQAANLFIYEEGQRLLLQREEDRFTDKRKEFSYTTEQLRDIAVTTPERLSNNVMTRPLMQEFLFPVLATVLGPGEIAYWSQTAEAFRLYGMRLPIIAPRLEFTLLEGTVLKHMKKYDLTFEDVIYRLEEKKQAWFDAQDTLQLAERFAEVKVNFRSGYEPLVELLAAINPGVQKLGESNLAKIMEQIEYLENKASDAYKAQFDTANRQLDRIQLSVLPLAKPQERVYNGCAYLNRYGQDWLKQLLDTAIPVDGLHRIYYL